MWDHSKGLVQVQGDDISCLPVVHQCQHCITEGTRWIRHGLPLVQPCWAMLAVPDDFFISQLPSHIFWDDLLHDLKYL